MKSAIDPLFQDLRLAVRKLMKKPAFTLVAVFSLALGIGANTAIFSVVNTVLLKPLPYPRSDEVVRVWETFRHPNGQGRGSVSIPNLRDWREQNQGFAAIGGYSMNNYNLMGESSPTWARGVGVTPQIFPLLGSDAMMGRTLGEGDQTHDRVVVLSHGLWQSFFGADTALVGTTIRLDGENYTVVGVMPPSFEFPPRSTAGLWTPLDISESWVENRGSHWLATVARLKPGVELDAARSDMEAVARRLEEQYPDQQEGRGVAIERLSESVVAGRRPALLALWGAVGFVLLIACGNVANLLLARAASQHREFAVRAALGAGRGRLAQQVLLESLLLAFLGGSLGLVVGWRAVHYLAAMPGTSLPAGQEVVFDARILIFCVFASLLAAVVAGLAPALRASRTNLQEAMKERSSSSGSHRDPIRAGLVVAEIALALVVLVGASLLIRSFLALQDVSPGVQTHNVLTLRIPLPDKYDTSEQIQGFYGPLLEKVAAIPGVLATGTVNLLPVQDWGWNGSFTVEGQADLAPSQQPIAEHRYVGGDYFGSLSIPLLAGRTFDSRDHAEAAQAVIINQTAAQRYWPGESAVDKRLSLDGGQSWTSIVGVVGDVRNQGLRNTVSPAIYFSHAQSEVGQMSLVVRTGVEAKAVTEMVRAEVRGLDPEQPIYLVQTMEQVVSTFLSSSRFNGVLFSLFGGLALVLATLGIYGVMSYNVTQRTGEIGLRMALGASRRDVVRLIVGQGLFLATIGAATGVAAAMGLTRFLESQLYEVQAIDVVSFSVVTAVLLTVALVACWVPARRAASVQPIIALHYE